MIEDLVPARKLVLIAPPLEERWPHACGRADRTELANRWEDALESLQQVVDLVAHDIDRIEIAVEVVVGRSEEREARVRHHQQVAAVDRLRADREPRDAVRVHDVYSLCGTQLHVDAGHASNLGN